MIYFSRPSFYPFSTEKNQSFGYKLIMNNICTIEKISRVYSHPNADALECVEVRNCQVIVPKGKHVEGEKIIFIWPDTILPDAEWSAFYKAKSSRVRAIKLRNEWSMGIVETFDKVAPEMSPDSFEIGQDVAEMFGVSKYEPPPPKDLQAKGHLPFDIPKTDEENHYNFNTLPYGAECVVTRKRDGSSCSFYYNLETDAFGVMSRSLELKPECHNAWTEHIAQYDIENRLRSYCKGNGVSLCIRGESFGNGRNGHKANVDAKEQTAWEMFSVWDIKARRYIPINEPHNFVDVSNACGFKHVPILEESVHLSTELVQRYANEKLGFEGVVIHAVGSTFKVINKEYDSRK
jgi:RNA ligase (TIGR02306 family)